MVVTLRKWFYLFWTTMLIGAAASGVTGFILQSVDQEFDFLGISAMGYNIFWMLVGGALISLVSQVGFFAYLIIRFIGLGIIRNVWTWNMLQLLILIIVVFDMNYLNYINIAGTAVLLLISFAVAYAKVRITNKSAWIPTLFFMSVGTLLEAQPALTLHNFASVVFMIVPLLACNTWQILILSKVLDAKKEPM